MVNLRNNRKDKDMVEPNPTTGINVADSLHILTNRHAKTSFGFHAGDRVCRENR